MSPPPSTTPCLTAGPPPPADRPLLLLQQPSSPVRHSPPGLPFLWPAPALLQRLLATAAAAAADPACGAPYLRPAYVQHTALQPHWAAGNPGGASGKGRCGGWGGGGGGGEGCACLPPLPSSPPPRPLLPIPSCLHNYAQGARVVMGDTLPACCTCMMADTLPACLHVVGPAATRACLPACCTCLHISALGVVAVTPTCLHLPTCTYLPAPT